MTIRLLPLLLCLSACTGRSPVPLAPAAGTTPVLAPATAAAPVANDKPWHPALTLLEDKTQYAVKKAGANSSLPCTAPDCNPSLEPRLIISDRLADADPDGDNAGKTVVCHDYQPTFVKSNMLSHTKESPYLPPSGFSCEGEQFIGPEDPPEGINGMWN